MKCVRVMESVNCGTAYIWTSMRVINISIQDFCLAINATITPSPFTVAQEGTDRPKDELLIARINMRKARFYGNYTKSFPLPKFKLTVVKQGKIFELLIQNVSEGDRGLYMCRVQEFKKHQDRWKASTNYTAATELREN
ncbi:hypothetical protein ILYODFUR_022201 [Ilyodon furcidens]|uniref:Uncharacterized protein n=1 Tax=Ilyodon furcidens TaxID=33524 RepID=A0ABV0SND3_9TELE